MVSSLLCPVQPPPTPTSALVLPATRRPSWALQEARSPDGQALRHRAGLGPQCPCQVLPAWGCGQLGSSWGLEGFQGSR